MTGNISDHQQANQQPRRTTVAVRKTWLVTLLLAVAALAITDLLLMTLIILLIVFAGMLFGLFVYSISQWLNQHLWLGYQFWFGVTVLVILLSLTGGFFYLGSQVAAKTSDLVAQLQSSIGTVQERLKEYEWAEQYIPDQQDVHSAVTEGSSNVVPTMMKGAQWLAWSFTAAIVILFVGFYAAFEPQLYRSGLMRLFPQDQRKRGEQVLEKLQAALGRWIIGRLVSMTLVGVITAIGLSIMGVPLPMTLGVLAAFFTFIPNIGPLLAAVPQVLLALNVGASTAIYVIIFNLVLQGIESYLITPLIQRHEVSLPPIVTITAQLLMGVWLGVIGIMMAAPLVVVIMVLTQMLYIKDRLGDPHPGHLAENL